MLFLNHSIRWLSASRVGHDRTDSSGSLPARCVVGLGLLMTISILSHNAAHAEWAVVDKRYQTPKLNTVYFDPQTIRRDNDLATLWELTDIKWAEGALTPRFLSEKTQKQFDCPRLRFRVLAVEQFSRQMGTGKSWSGYIENGNWQAVEAQSVNHGLWEAACKKK